MMPPTQMGKHKICVIKNKIATNAKGETKSTRSALTMSSFTVNHSYSFSAILGKAIKMAQPTKLIAITTHCGCGLSSKATIVNRTISTVHVNLHRALVREYRDILPRFSPSWIYLAAEWGYKSI